MKTYLLYIAGLVTLMAGLSVCVLFHLVWPSIALAVLLLWLCASLYSRMSRIIYAYRETEKENEKLHTRLAEAERQQQYLCQLTENVDTALFVCSTDGRIDWMNHAASGIVSGSFLPDNILQSIAEQAEMVDGCALSAVLLRIDGQRRLVVALKDVSMLMQRQEMEAWQQLIRVLTHEIMNSLTPIISISETLTNENEAFTVINRRCHALLGFVESYRQLTRIKTPERTTFPVSELFEHVKALFPKLSTPLPHREGPGEGLDALLYADRTQLEQVLINIIKNAYESGATEVELTAHNLPSHPEERLRVGEHRSGMGPGEGSVIRIKDNGCGMSPDVIDHAFIPFFTTKPAGTGIGLALCRQIILKHGGTISVDSQEGKGTTFTIALPSVPS